MSKPGFSTGMLLGVTLALIAIIRPSNLIIALYLLLVDTKSWNDVKNRIVLLVQNRSLLIIVTVTFIIGLLPQLLYWREVTGDLFVFSYGHAGQGFNWFSPALIKVLFSPQNGWLIYTPIMLLALIGLVTTFKKGTHNGFAISVIMLLTYYLFSSWWAWWFGAAYGHRAFVEYYALLSIPLAFTLTWVLNISSRIIKSICLLLVSLAVYVNWKMCFLYVPPWDGENWGWDDYGNIISTIF